MAYTTNTFSCLAGGPIEGNWKLWYYATTDTLAQMLAAGYVTDATAKGMTVGDFVIVANQTNPAGYILQVQSITAASGNTPGTATLTQPAGVGGSSQATPRNILDGGDFTTNPWQRGTSFTSISNTLTYTADRWFALGGPSSSISVSQVSGITAVPGFSQALQFGRASGNANTATIALGQVIETLDAIRCQGQQVTLSFWAAAGANWSPASGNLLVQVVYGTGTNQSAANLMAGAWTGQAGISLAPNQAGAVAGTIVNQPITTTWTRYSFTGTVPTNATQPSVVLEATPVGTAGAADYVQLMGIQFEIGAQATPFEHRDIELELALAQRYFFNIPEPAAGVVVGAGMVGAANSEIIFIPLPVQMRAAPTVSVSPGSFNQHCRHRDRGRWLCCRHDSHAELHQRRRDDDRDLRPGDVAPRRRRRRLHPDERGFLRRRQHTPWRQRHGVCCLREFPAVHFSGLVRLSPVLPLTHAPNSRFTKGMLP
jgi:hypothetical protein